MSSSKEYSKGGSQYGLGLGSDVTSDANSGGLDILNLDWNILG